LLVHKPGWPAGVAAATAVARPFPRSKWTRDDQEAKPPLLVLLVLALSSAGSALVERVFKAGLWVGAISVLIYVDGIPKGSHHVRVPIIIGQPNMCSAAAR
jgi:hypothetical protein